MPQGRAFPPSAMQINRGGTGRFAADDLDNLVSAAICTSGQGFFNLFGPAAIFLLTACEAAALSVSRRSIRWRRKAGTGWRSDPLSPHLGRDRCILVDATDKHVVTHTYDAIRSALTWIVDALGGQARLQVIAVLGAVLGLDTADTGTVSAVSDQLKSAFQIGNTEIGLLLAVVSFIRAGATLPLGAFADRMPRRRILMVAIAGWGATMIAGGLAGSYTLLLLTRLVLGAATAVAWPCVASLTGDFFPARERGKIYGMIISGELVGAGIGFFVAGEISTVLGWHWAFFVMAVPSLLVVWGIWRYLPEPARGAQSWLKPGEHEAAEALHPRRNEQQSGPDKSAVHEAARKAEIKPREHLVLHEDPTHSGWWWALGYLLRLPSYRLLVAASSLAYFFFAGIGAFAMIYFTKHYDLSRGIVSPLVFALGGGGIIGLIVGGRVSEWLLDHGNLNARIIVPAVGVFVSVPLLGAGIWTTNVWLGVLLITLGCGALAAAVAPIDAARLDIVHPRLWGRGEAGRMSLRSLLEGGAPLLFGALSAWLGGGAQGLMWTFLIMLIPLAGAGLFVLPGMRSYPRDIATAAASVEATAQQRKDVRHDKPTGA
jgi:sugar phosphate permease